MMIPVPSKILLASFAPTFENSNLRCITIYPNQKTEKTNSLFSSLESVQEITLAPKMVYHSELQEDWKVVFIPLVGKIGYCLGDSVKEYLETEEVIEFASDKYKDYKVENPSDMDLISYLQIRFKGNQSKKDYTRIETFNSSKKNTFLPILEQEQGKLSFGFFGGRKEGFYHLQREGNKIFAYVVHGAFEFQNRLLETRDAIAIWNLNTIEVEALSENAILVLLELKE